MSLVRWEVPKILRGCPESCQFCEKAHHFGWYQRQVAYQHLSHRKGTIVVLPRVEIQILKLHVHSKSYGTGPCLPANAGRSLLCPKLKVLHRLDVT